MYVAAVDTLSGSKTELDVQVMDVLGMNAMLMGYATDYLASMMKGM